MPACVVATMDGHPTHLYFAGLRRGYHKSSIHRRKVHTPGRWLLCNRGTTPEYQNPTLLPRLVRNTIDRYRERGQGFDERN